MGKELIDMDVVSRMPGVDPDVVEVYRHFKRFLEAPARAKWKDRADEAWRAMENEMWSDADKKELEKQGMVPLVVNKINKGVQGSCALVTDQRPGLVFRPIGSGDRYVAELLERGWRFVWDKNHGQDVTYEACEDCRVGAMGWFTVWTDRSRPPVRGSNVLGRAVLETVDADEMYFDPKSRKKDLSDSHLIRARLRSMEWLKETYGDDLDPDLILFNGHVEDDEEGSKSSGVTGEDNYAIEATKKPPKDEDGNMRDPRRIWEIEAWMIRRRRVSVSDGVYFTAVERERESIVGGQLMGRKTNPMGTDGDGDPLVPFVRLPAQRVKGAYPMSPTDYALPLNREKNKRRAQFIAVASHNVNSPIVQKEGVKWSGHPGTPGTTATVPQNVDFPGVTRLTSGAFEAAKFLELESLADRDIDDQFDLQDVLRGRIPPGQSKIATDTVLALQDMGAMMTKPFLRSLESCLERVGLLIMSVILREWDIDMWIRLLEDEELAKLDAATGERVKEADPEIVAKWAEALGRITGKKIDPETMQVVGDFLDTNGNKVEPITLLDLDVRMVAGSTMPTSRMAKASFAMNMANAGLYDRRTALEYIDDPNADKVMKRLEEEAQQAMTAQTMKQGGR